MTETFEAMLTGGHPNSLGRTEEVVASVLAEPARLDELFGCYDSADAVVRLRTSSAIKRVEAARSALMVPHIDRLIEKVGALDQASAQWTLAQLFDRLAHAMSPGQKARALGILKRNLEHHSDWIVLNTTIDTLTRWARDDAALASWLAPHLDRHAHDPRKSVAGRARKAKAALDQR